MQSVTHTCPKCGQEKPIHEFYHCGSRKKYQVPCANCYRKLQLVQEDSDPHDPRVRLLARSKERALKSGIEHRITINDIPIPSTCKYLGITLCYRGSREKGPHRWSDNLATLDRIDSSKGYIPGNVQVISHLANCMKYKATIEQLLTFAHGVLRVHDV